MFDAIRRAVAAEHELAVDAIVLIKAGSIPKTSSGKIQRHACRDGYLGGHAWTWSARWRAADGVAAEPRRRVEPRRSAAARSNRSAPQPRNAAHAARRCRPRRTAATAPSNERVTQLVVEEIRRVAKERAEGMTLDSPIVETGMDSLGADGDRRLAGRDASAAGFPRKSCPTWKPPRQLVAAVEKYLGTEPRRRKPTAGRRARFRRPPTASTSSPSTSSCGRTSTCSTHSGLGNPFFIGPRGRHQRPHDHRRPRV